MPSSPNGQPSDHTRAGIYQTVHDIHEALYERTVGVLDKYHLVYRLCPQG
ncbi:MAG: hypothetical protein H0T78_00685 [Longispora sp.]|nr:hypothetical protein [Longispora sp. (in: high G+C Gram-positive bacteria)]